MTLADAPADRLPVGPGLPWRLPSPRGPVTDHLLGHLARPVHELSPLPRTDGDPLRDDDVALTGLVDQEPLLGGDVVFGARTLTAVESMFASHLLDAWERDESSLRPG